MGSASAILMFPIRLMKNKEVTSVIQNGNWVYLVYGVILTLIILLINFVPVIPQ